METTAVALSALSAALGGICLFVLTGIVRDIRDIRIESAKNTVDIAVHTQALKEAELLS